MRTTISIEDALLQKAKKISHERRCSLRTVIEDADRGFARFPSLKWRHPLD